ncbi:MAG TPA: LptE family protein [Saprospiraceae bacterium]|nr:LptE family protein [Saprospiraceae bacterium]
MIDFQFFKTKILNLKSFFFSGLLLFFLSHSGCYSLSGISIDPNSKTFFVNQFENRAAFIEPIFSIDLTERLKDRIRSSSRLFLSENNADLTFSGVISNFYISAEAPQAGAVPAFNRLNVSISVELESAKNEKENWKKTFTRYVDFPNDQTFESVKTELMDEVIKQLVDDIFNEAFTKNW